MENKKKIIIIISIAVISLILIGIILVIAFKHKDTYENNNNVFEQQQQQSTEISLKAKASKKTLKFTVDLGNIEDIEFSVEKSYNEQFNDSIEVLNSYNNNQPEDDLTFDLENSVEKCFYRVKANNNGNIIYSNVITITLKKSSSDTDFNEGYDIENEFNEEDDNDEINIEDGSYDNNEYDDNGYNDVDDFSELTEEDIGLNEVSDEVEYISLSETEIDFDLSGYKQTTLTAIISPSNVKNNTLTWTSSNAKVATVDKSGNVTAKSNGTTIITVKSSNGITQSCEVNVITSVSSVSLNKSSINLDMLNKREETLTANIYPSTSSDKTVIWTSSNESVAVVDSNGNITAKSNGTATIKCESSNGKVATCQVNVTTSGSGVYLNETRLEFNLGQTTSSKLIAIVVPSSTNNKTITWTSSNPNVASVDSNGNVTAKSVGTTTITAKTANGQTATCVVTVQNIVYNITLNSTSYKIVLPENNTYQLSVKSYTPSNAPNKTVTWTSSNPNVATVNSNGLVTAKKLGKTTITATCGKAKATCAIVVKYNKSYKAYYYDIKTKTVTTTKCANQGSVYGFYMYIPDTENCVELNTLPLVTFLHGGSGRVNMDGWKATGLQQRLQDGEIDYNAIIIIPCAHDGQTTAHSDFRNAVKAIEDFVSTEYKVNKNKISIIGTSNGAAGAWLLIREYKSYYSAGILASGYYMYTKGLDPTGLPPVWIMYGGHGDNGGDYSVLTKYYEQNSLPYKFTNFQAKENPHSVPYYAIGNDRQYIEWLISQ